VPALIQALIDSEATVRRSAAAALGQLNDPAAVPPLIQVLIDSEATVRRSAATALGNLGNVSAIQPLIDLLDDADVTVRRHTAEALSRFVNADPHVSEVADQIVSILIPWLDDRYLGRKEDDVIAALLRFSTPDATAAVEQHKLKPKPDNSLGRLAARRRSPFRRRY
jgi:HEAT repeat protein